jgi:outer membrane protein assembly factor BamB
MGERFPRYGAPNGESVLRGFAYNSQTHAISLAWQSAELSGSISSPVLSSDYTRIYVQTQNGTLYAFDTSTGAVIWSFNLGVSALGTPTVTDFGYIMPGMRQSDSPTVNYVGILQDNGSSASWAYQTTDFAADSLATVGRQNRFVLIAKRASDNALVLLVVSPKFGVMSQTQMTIEPLPPRIDGMVIDQNGWVYASTWGSSVYRAFSPTYETTVP